MRVSVWAKVTQVSHTASSCQAGPRSRLLLAIGHAYQLGRKHICSSCALHATVARRTLVLCAAICCLKRPFVSVQEHLQEVLPSILDGLADEAEGVRDAALAAGRTFVDLYAETALPLLLPAVEDGILNDNWRIRQSSVELLGQLLFKVLIPFCMLLHTVEFVLCTHKLS